MGKFDLNDIFGRAFDKINLPSKGVFYPNGEKSFKVRYLSGIEEKVLTSMFLTESGEALELVLENTIIEDFPIRDLVISDLQGIMLFLYATAYGDLVPYKMECPSCGYSDEMSIRLSDIDFKKTEIQPVDGAWSFMTPMRNNFLTSDHQLIVVGNGTKNQFVELKLTPVTFGRELDMKKEGKDLRGINRVINSIESVGGITDREYIEKAVKTMNLKDFKKLRIFSESNDLALDDKVSVTCPACGYDHSFQFNFGYDFLKLPEKHRENIMEECFLISHYSESGMNFVQAMNLPITERRWYLQRVSDELEKKREAEKKAMDAAKAKGKSAGR